MHRPMEPARRAGPGRRASPASPRMRRVSREGLRVRRSPARIRCGGSRIHGAGRAFTGIRPGRAGGPCTRPNDRAAGRARPASPVRGRPRRTYRGAVVVAVEPTACAAVSRTERHAAATGAAREGFEPCRTASRLPRRSGGGLAGHRPGKGGTDTARAPRAPSGARSRTPQRRGTRHRAPAAGCRGRTARSTGRAIAERRPEPVTESL